MSTRTVVFDYRQPDLSGTDAAAGGYVKVQPFPQVERSKPGYRLIPEQLMGRLVEGVAEIPLECTDTYTTGCWVVESPLGVTRFITVPAGDGAITADQCPDVNPSSFAPVEDVIAAWTAVATTATEAAAAAEAAQAAAEAVPTTTDGIVTALVSDPGSAMSAALSSTIGAAVESSIPTGLGWAGPSITPALESTIIPGRRQVGEVGATPEEMFDAVSTARSAPGATFYVTTTGSDSAAGTAWGTAFLTMSKAIQAANAAGVPTRINVGPGIYARAGSPYNASTVPTVDIALIASGGRVNVGVFDLITSSTLDGTYANCYTYTLANCDRVCDLTQRDRFGNYVDMRKVTSTAICNRTPNSWILTGGVLYVNRADGAAITTTNTRVYRTVTYAMAVTSAVNVFIGGNGYGAGFDFEGGSTSVIAFNQGAGGATAAQKTVVIADSTILYGTANGLSAETWPGTVACFATRADANGADGFNIHNTYTAPAAACRLLTVNCTARDNGRSGNSSCNGLTGHETTRIVDVAGYYEANHGGTVAVVGSAKAYLIGTTVKDDLGDLMLGGTNPPSGVKVANTVELWAERVTVDMPQGGLVWNAIDATSSVHRRNCPPVPAPDAGSGTFDTY